VLGVFEAVEKGGDGVGLVGPEAEPERDAPGALAGRPDGEAFAGPPGKRGVPGVAEGVPEEGVRDLVGDFRVEVAAFREMRLGVERDPLEFAPVHAPGLGAAELDVLLRAERPVGELEDDFGSVGGIEAEALAHRGRRFLQHLREPLQQPRALRVARIFPGVGADLLGRCGRGKRQG
jgi:hypothetical protein